jgi:hypothetical protein
MAEPNTPKSEKGEDSDLLKLAAERWEAAYSRERTNIEEAILDLEFLAGDDDAHWGPGVKARRLSEERPCLTINVLPQYVEQVTGDQRQMRPSMRVVPGDSRADADTADVIAGMFRYIERRSTANTVYNRAGESQAACGIGAFRIVREYASDSTFEQEIGIRSIDDQIMVLFDPDASELSRADAQYCFVPVDLSREAFKTRYPKASPAGFGEALPGTGFGSDWVSDDCVRISEYFYKEPTKKLLALLPDGGVDDLTDEKDPGKSEELKAQGARIEERDAFCVYRAVISSTEVLEGPTKEPGRFIPIIPVIGRELRISRRIVRKGVIRDARDATRIKNYTTSAQVEVTALQPKAPFLGTELHFQDHEAQWERANTENRPFLTYTPDPMAPGSKPERVQPPVASQGLAAVLAQADLDIERTIGIYKSSLGAESNETSGKAIMARDKQADTSTFVFLDNYNHAIAHAATVVLDLIPHVYDTQRQVLIVGVDGSEELTTINQPQGMAMEGEHAPPMLNDVTVGAYHVALDSGPSYATKREAAREGMLAFIQSLPDAAPRVADLIAKSMEWPDADAFAERLMPPDVAQKEAQAKGEPPPGPNPAMVQQQLAEHVQQAQAQIADQQKRAEQQVAIEKAQAELELQKQAIALAKQEVALQAKAVQMEAKSLQDTEAHQAKVGEHQQAEAEATMPAVSGLAETLAQMQQINAALMQSLAQIGQNQQQDGQALQALLLHATAPKRIVRDPLTGLVAGTEPAPALN